MYDIVHRQDYVTCAIATELKGSTELSIVAPPATLITTGTTGGPVAQGQIQATASPMYLSFMSEDGDTTDSSHFTILPDAEWHELDPGHGLIDELTKNKALRAKVPRIAKVAE